MLEVEDCVDFPVRMTMPAGKCSWLLMHACYVDTIEILNVCASAILIDSVFALQLLHEQLVETCNGICFIHFYSPNHKM